MIALKHLGLFSCHSLQQQCILFFRFVFGGFLHHVCRLICFTLCSSSLLLICSPDFLPPPPLSLPVPPHSHRPSSVFAPVVFHQRRTKHLSAPVLLTLERPVFARCYRPKHEQACVCVHCSFIEFQAYRDQCCPLEAH